MSFAPGVGVQPIPVLPAPGEEGVIPASGIINWPRVQHMTLVEFAAFPAAAQISLRRYGRRTRLKRTDITLAAGVPQQLVGNDPERISLNMTNSGTANSATLTSDADKTVAQGDAAGANGGGLASVAIEDGEATTAAWFGISTAGTTIHVDEVVAYGPFVLLPPEVETFR